MQIYGNLGYLPAELLNVVYELVLFKEKPVLKQRQTFHRVTNDTFSQSDAEDYYLTTLDVRHGLVSLLGLQIRMIIRDVFDILRNERFLFQIEGPAVVSEFARLVRRFDPGLEDFLDYFPSTSLSICFPSRQQTNQITNGRCATGTHICKILITETAS